MSFGKNLKQELIYSGILKKELAAKAGVNKRAIDTYVRTNSSMPPADTAVKIAKALGVTVEYLVTGEETTISREAGILARSILKLSKRDLKIVTMIVKEMGNKEEC